MRLWIKVTKSKFDFKQAQKAKFKDTYVLVSN